MILETKAILVALNVPYKKDLNAIPNPVILSVETSSLKEMKHVMTEIKTKPMIASQIAH